MLFSRFYLLSTFSQGVSYNDGLKYQLFVDKSNPNIEYYVIALYDEGFAGNYIPDSTTNEKMSLYGSLSTRGYYYFYEDKNHPGQSFFSFLSIYPSKFNLSSQESLKFANGVIEYTNDEIYADGYDDGVETGLVLLSRDKSYEINWPLCSKDQTYNYNSLSGRKDKCEVNYTDSCRKLIISKSDIAFEPSQQINTGTRYVIKPREFISHGAHVPACIYEESTQQKIGELSNTYSFVSINSIRPTPVRLAIGSIEDYAAWDFDADYITLYRDEKSGEFRYRFSDKNGEETSNKDLVAYCADTKNCKMKDLNLFPNVRTYIKSILTSADIGDFQATGSIDATAVSLNVTNTLKVIQIFKKL
ncbi:hypothetical protein [Wolbachia endosymbiont (group E) of Neria commutata]|uniref:hypothetical protein n=1 Tax=Wolbachia endosymbiont (group E) of Neria commutata TaxID=3066149 RepID=UPI003133389F